MSLDHSSHPGLDCTEKELNNVQNNNMQSLLTLGTHAQRGLQYLVCVCVLDINRTGVKRGERRTYMYTQSQTLLECERLVSITAHDCPGVGAN